MPAFTPFPNQLYDPDVEYTSVSALIETDANWAELEIITPSAIIDELPTTEISLAIEIADVLVSNPPTPDDGLPHDLDYTYYPGEFRLAFSASITGTDGVALSKPGNPLIRSVDPTVQRQVCQGKNDHD